jgi:hypothetical protein
LLENGSGYRPEKCERSLTQPELDKVRERDQSPTR